MRAPLRLTAALVALALIAGCGKADDKPAQTAVSSGEAKALGEASEMIQDPRPSPEPAATPAPPQPSMPSTDPAG